MQVKELCHVVFMSNELRRREVQCLKSCRPPLHSTRELFPKGAPAGEEGGHASWVVFQDLSSWSWDRLPCPGFGWSQAQWGLRVCTDPASLTPWDTGCSSPHPETRSCQKDVPHCNAVTGRWGLLSLFWSLKSCNASQKRQKKAPTHKCGVNLWTGELQVLSLEAVVLTGGSRAVRVRSADTQRGKHSPAAEPNEKIKILPQTIS